MIPYDKKTTQDFLSVEEMEKLNELGVDFGDAKYTIVKRLNSDDKYIVYGGHDEWKANTSIPDVLEEVIQTYTIAEIIYKLPEWLIKDGYEGLSFFKDAPFYGFFYKNSDADKQEESCCISEYPIESAAWLLRWCIKNGHGYSKDVSGK